MTGEMAILDVTGDTKILWDSTKPEEVEVAKDTFDKLKKKGYLAFAVEGKDGTKGKKIDKFDPNIERLIMAPILIGG